MGLEPTEELGRAIMALRYDLLGPVLTGMLQEANRQKTNDEAAGHVKLAFRLNDLSAGIENALEGCHEVMRICRPHIEAEKAYLSVKFSTPLYVENIGDKIQFRHHDKDYVVHAQQVGFAIGGRVDETGWPTLIYG